MRVHPGADSLYIKYPTDIRWIIDGIHKALNEITKNNYETWCNNQSLNIGKNILGFIVGLQKTGNLILVWKDITKIIYNAVIEQLELSEQEHSNDYIGILQDISFIHCERCNKKYPVIFRDECPECSYYKV